MSALSTKIALSLPPTWRRAAGDARRATRRSMRRTRWRIEHRLAWGWRRVLRRTTFVAIVGSLGKTTTRELLHAVLSEEAQCLRSPGNANGGAGLSRILLAARPWHRYCIVEIGVAAPGDMTPRARLVRPDVVLLLNVARCHLNVFRDTDAVLAEKVKVVDAMRPGGIVVTNDACPEIAALALPAHLRRVRFAGWRAPSDAAGETVAGVPAEERVAEPIVCRLVSARSRWPEPLSVELEYAAEDTASSIPRRVRYRTRLVGEHWANAVLAAAAAARALGVGHASIAAGLERVPNWSSRLEPVRLPERRATYVRDDYNGSIDTYRSSLAWLAVARATRRVVIYGNASDMPRAGGNRRRAKRLARLVAAHSDRIVAITPYPEIVRRAAAEAGLDASHVTTLATVHEAIDWCRTGIESGDLLLCKGRGDQKLERIFLGLFGDVACRRDECGRKPGCDGCPELGFAVTSAMRRGAAPLLPGGTVDIGTGVPA